MCWLYNEVQLYFWAFRFTHLAMMLLMLILKNQGEWIHNGLIGVAQRCEHSEADSVSEEFLLFSNNLLLFVQNRPTHLHSRVESVKMQSIHRSLLDKELMLAVLAGFPVDVHSVVLLVKYLLPLFIEDRLGQGVATGPLADAVMLLIDYLRIVVQAAFLCFFGCFGCFVKRSRHYMH